MLRSKLPVCHWTDCMRTVGLATFETEYTHLPICDHHAPEAIRAGRNVDGYELTEEDES